MPLPCLSILIVPPSLTLNILIIQYSTVKYSTVKCSTVLWGEKVQHSTRVQQKSHQSLATAAGARCCRRSCGAAAVMVLRPGVLVLRGLGVDGHLVRRGWGQSWASVRHTAEMRTPPAILTVSWWFKSFGDGWIWNGADCHKLVKVRIRRQNYLWIKSCRLYIFSSNACLAD